MEEKDIKNEEEIKNDDSSDEKIIEIKDADEEAGPVEDEEPVEEISEEEKLKAKVTELEEKLLRNAAEFDNFKKRTARQYDLMAQSAKEAVLSEVLDIYDNFQRALDHQNEKGEDDNQAIVDGIKLIFSQMKNLIEKNNITPIDAIGKPFDPNFHEALMQIDSDEFEEGTVALEISKGYKMGDQVIRHSKVGVSRGPLKEEENNDSEDEK